MSKVLPIVLGAVLIIGMSANAVIQYNTIKKEKLYSKQLNEENAFLEESLDTETQENTQLTATNSVLRQKIAELRDSMNMLNKEVITLRKKVRKQDKTIKSIQSKLRKIENNYIALRQQISELSHKEQVDRDLILQLEQEKALLRNQLEGLSIEKEQEVLARQETQAELLDKQVSEARFARITNITNNTKVNFQSIKARKKQFGKPISKINPGSDKWRYTTIEFFLEHEDLKLLLDEKFIVKIVNSDTHEILSRIESNPNFPNSQKDSKGSIFKYDGNLVEISYFNNQKKEGKNYEVQISYISDTGEEYQLLDGIQSFIIGGKVRS